ncbi:MAG: hypothetical protein HWD90_13030, partial [Campylobacteraceae bacterium]|nr:hypothetical protein [Campylobacteraceae bacterium]
KPIQNREIKTNKLSFNLVIPTNEEREFYLQLKGKYAYFGNLQLYNSQEFFFNEQISINSFYIFIFGIFTIVLIFSGFLFIKLKEKIYFYYFGYAFFYLIYTVNISGVLVYLNLQYYIYELQATGAFTTAFLTLFSIEYLKIKKHLKWFHKVLTLVAYSLFVLGILLIYSYTPWNKVINNTVGFINLLLIVTSIVLYFKGQLYTKYYIFIMLLFFTFIILFTMMVAGVVEYDLITRYGYIFGSSIELIFFTLLLVNNYAVAKNKQIKYQNDLLLFKNNQEKLLKEEVEKRTKELNKTNKKLSNLVKERELLLKEVFHRVKNNFHMITGILWFESQKYKEKDIFTELINRIKSMSKLHEYLLYSSNNLKEINSKTYLKDILENIMSAYSKKDFKLNFEIHKIDLNFDEALYLGIIINEIVSNSIKHNKSQDNKIDLSFKELDGKLRLDIKDDGDEFSQNKKGLGLNLVDEFSKKLNSSKYFFSFEKGTCFTLEFLKKVDE